MKKRKQCCSTNRDGYRCMWARDHGGSHMQFLEIWIDWGKFSSWQRVRQLTWRSYGGWR